TDREPPPELPHEDHAAGPDSDPARSSGGPAWRACCAGRRQDDRGRACGRRAATDATGVVARSNARREVGARRAPPVARAVRRRLTVEGVDVGLDRGAAWPLLPRAGLPQG